MHRTGDDFILALLRASELSCGPVAISGDAPCELTLRNGRVHIASNLSRAGRVMLQLPAGVQLTRGTREGDLWRLDLPAGKFGADLN